MPRMRTIAECARMIKEDDPGTAITANAIRTKVLRNEVPHVQIGKKRLINYDQLLELLKNPPAQASAQTGLGSIRPIN